jgi:predicted RND superfamily exporter protein
MSQQLFQIVKDLAWSLGSATFIILFVLAVAYRSVRIGLISVVPNVFPLVATGALLVVLGEPLFIASVCAFTVCLGIAVDDTIHFLSRYEQMLAESADVNDAIRKTYLSVGTPMVMTTVILVSGFATVLMSDLPAHRTFGAMASATIGTAIVGDLVALPAMLATFGKRKEPSVMPQ